MARPEGATGTAVSKTNHVSGCGVGTDIRVHIINCDFRKGPPCDARAMIHIFQLKKQVPVVTVPRSQGS